VGGVVFLAAGFFEFADFRAGLAKHFLRLREGRILFALRLLRLSESGQQQER
jgi:hypothetical protein